MHNAKNKQLSDIPFKKLFVIDNSYVHGIGIKDENYILNFSGNIKKLEGISQIQDLFDGRMAARFNKKYGFINNAGEIVISFKYNSIENFKDGVAIVSNNENKFSIINTDGKVIVPL